MLCVVAKVRVSRFLGTNNCSEMSLPRLCTHRASTILLRRTSLPTAISRGYAPFNSSSAFPASRLFSSSSFHGTGASALTETQTAQRSGSDSHESQNEEKERVLYERRPDWYIRLIPLLIVLDLAML